MPSFDFLANHHLCSSIHHYELVEMGGLYGISHYVAIGITSDLRRGLLEEFFHLLVRGARLAIFQFDDVALFRLYVLHLYVVPTEYSVGTTSKGDTSTRASPR